ncbi:MAG: disulfide bond formation protein B [Burkholderiales bacterium]|nr:MAG: disulfide bond formation protein B [Burkholderiales bacterium]
MGPLGRHPRRALALVGLACLGLLLFGIYLQHVEGLEPCPMCIVQRYALILVGLLAVLAAAVGHGRARSLATAGAFLSAGFGAFVAARQSWLQWFPPEVLSCGRDFYGMIESFPLKRAIPMIFRGSGDCSAVDWTFLGLTIANWSFVWFCAFALLLLGLLLRRAPD